MADETPIGIALKVSSDATALKELNASFKELAATIIATSNTTKQLGVMMEHSTELAGIKALLGGMAQVQQSTAKLTAASQQEAAQARAATNVRLMALNQQVAGLAQATNATNALAAANQKAAQQAKNLTQQSGGGGGFELFKKGALFGAGLAAINEAKTALVSFFRETLVEGVKFNSELEQTQLALAAVFKQAHFSSTFEEGTKRSGEAIDLLRKKAEMYGLDLEALIESYKTNSSSMFRGGISSLTKQIDLTVTLSNAAKAMNVTGFQAVRDTQDILLGMSEKTKLGKELGLDDSAIKNAAKAGQLYEYLTERLAGFAEAASRGATTVQGLQTNLHNAVLTTAAKETEDLTVAYKGLLVALTDLVKSDGFKGVMTMLGSLSKNAVEAAEGIAIALSWNANPSSKITADLKADLAAAKSIQEVELVNSRARAQLRALDASDKGKGEQSDWISTLAKYGTTWGSVRAALAPLEKKESANVRGELNTIISQSSNTRPGSPAADLVAKNRGGNGTSEANAKAHSDFEQQMERVNEYIKGAKAISVEESKSADVNERKSRLIEAQAGNYQDVLAALKLNEDSVRRQYDTMRAMLPEGATEDKRKEYYSLLAIDEEKELLAIKRDRVAVTKQINQIEFDGYQQEARRGTLADQIAAKEALIVRVKAEGKSDAANRIKEIEYEIKALNDREAAQRRASAFDEQQRRQRATYEGIARDPYLTAKEKRAQTYGLLVNEQAALPGQIATAEDKAAGEAPGSMSQSGYLSQAKTLRGRQASIGVDMEAAKPKSMMEDITASVVELQNHFATIGQTISGVMGSAIDGVSSSLQGLIKGTMTWGSALQNIGGSILNGVISGFSRMFAEWIVGRLTMSAVAQAASAKEGLVDTVAKTPGALLTSISSFGVAAAIGVAALIAAMAAFDVGGFTSPGPRDKPAGIVHAGEWVAPQWMVNDDHAGPLIQALEMQRTGEGKGYSIGGFIKDSLRYGGVPKWLQPLSKQMDKYNLMDGTKVYGEKLKDGIISDTRTQSQRDQLDALRVSGGISSNGVGLSASQASGGAGGPVQGSGVGAPVYIGFYNTKEDTETFLSSPEGRRIMIDFLRQQSHEI